MFDKHVIAAHFGKAAAGYNRHAKLQDICRRDLFSWSEFAVGRLLDLGAGTGLLRDLTKSDALEIIHCDLAFGMCEQARKHSALVVNGDAHRLPFAGGSFDAVFSSLMLQWVEERQSVFRECERLLKPGGRVAINTLLPGSLAELADAFSVVDTCPHISSFTEAAIWQRDAVASGLKLIKTRQKDYVHFHPTAKHLMHELKAIGAQNKLTDRRMSFLTPGHLAKVEAAYRARYSEDGQLKVTWRCFAMLLEK